MIPKIRVWDELGERMVYNAGFTPEGIAYTIPKNAEDSDRFDYYPECPVMQDTGLKDKDGKKIYERDIVDQSYISPMTKELVKRHYVVEWENGKYKMTFIKDKMHYDKYLWMEFMRVEVIGNFYENPELLK